MLFRLALNNVLLNRRRIIITIALSAFSVMFFIFYLGLLKGSFSNLYKNSLELYSGYIQITGKNYIDDPSNEHLIFNEKEVLAKLKDEQSLKNVTSRFESFALYASEENAYGAQFIGVHPSKELEMTKMPRHIKSGRYLQDDDTNGVVIGSELAKRLKIDLGGKLSVITTGTDYSFAADNLFVVGIIKTYIPEIDNYIVYINKSYFDDLMESKNIATHIILQPKDVKKSLELVKNISKLLDDDTLHIEDWHTYLSAMIQMEQMKLSSGSMMIALFILLIFFVVLIYTYLSVQSRIKEIGIMRAIGTKPREILIVLLYETSILALISVALGGAAGAYLTYYVSLHPIAIPMFEEMYREYGILEAVWVTEFSWDYAIMGVSYVLILNLISIIYPAWTVIRIKPIDAINHI